MKMFVDDRVHLFLPVLFEELVKEPDSGFLSRCVTKAICDATVSGPVHEEVFKGHVADSQRSLNLFYHWPKAAICLRQTSHLLKNLVEKPIGFFRTRSAPLFELCSKNFFYTL